MSSKVLTVNDGNDKINEYNIQIKSRKNSFQSYDSLVNNKLIITSFPQIITKTNKIQSEESITLKITTENVPKDNVIFSQTTSSKINDDYTPSSSLFSPAISKLINDINDTLYEKIAAIKNRNDEINKDILDKVINFRNNQHELILNLLTKFENNDIKSSGINNNNDNNADNNNKENNNNNNNIDNNDDDDDINKNDNILFEILSKIKNDNIEFLNNIDSTLLYNINMKYASNNDLTSNKNLNTNSNEENKILFTQKCETLLDDESKNNEQNNNTMVESENINFSLENLNVSTDNSNNSSVTLIKRFIKLTGISKLPYINSMTKSSSSNNSTSVKLNDKKSKKSKNTKKGQHENASVNSNINISIEHSISIISLNDNDNKSNSQTLNIDKRISKETHSTDELQSNFKDIQAISHKKSHSESFKYNKMDMKFNTPLPINNIESRDSKDHLSVSGNNANEKRKGKTKDNELDKKMKEKEKEKKKEEKEKKKEEEKEKKFREKEKKIKEKEKEKELKIKNKLSKENELDIKFKDKKKRKNNVNLQKTNSILEIQRRMKNVFDNYQVKLLGRELGAHPILTHKIADKILQNITPIAYKEYRNWRLLYSLEYHGSHPQTLYDAVFEKIPLVTAIMDEDGYIFGAYSTEYFHIDSHYYGNGQTFLWKYKVDENENEDLQIFRATGSNHYYIISEKNYLAFGGGKGFGLHIMDDFTYGFTDNCETYNNDILACKKDFKCINIEVWCLEL